MACVVPCGKQLATGAYDIGQMKAAVNKGLTTVPKAPPLPRPGYQHDEKAADATAAEAEAKPAKRSKRKSTHDDAEAEEAHETATTSGATTAAEPAVNVPSPVAVDAIKRPAAAEPTRTRATTRSKPTPAAEPAVAVPSPVAACFLPEMEFIEDSIDLFERQYGVFRRKLVRSCPDRLPKHIIR